MDNEGKNLQLVVNANAGRTRDLWDPEWLMEFGVYASLSPDGSRLVYSSCQYKAMEWPVPSPEEGKRGTLGYEIISINVDGTEPSRTTHNNAVDHYPEWSPNGESIAYITRPSYHYGLAISGGKHHPSALTAPFPPVWSPDSQYLAFLSTVEGIEPEFGRAIYILGPDRTTLNRMGDYTTFSSTLPTWSTDGERLAFAHSLAATSVIYTVKPDGTDLREIWKSETHESAEPIQQVAWSPDGSEILVVSSRLWTISPDGSVIRSIGPVNSSLPITDATWSPDGSRIAAVISDVRYTYEGSSHRNLDLDGSILIVTMARDGTDFRVLVAAHTPEGDHNSPIEIYAVNTPSLGQPVDPSVCIAGSVVPEPQDNPGLIRDCEVLLQIRDELSGRATLNWSPKLTIMEWEGVEVEETPPRVKALRLTDKGLTGTIPPEIGLLSELRELSLYGSPAYTPNILTGSIPSELGQLSKLEWLGLGENFLSGSIPEELGRLENLRGLRVSGNFLSGCIPENLRKIERHDFEDTGLEFCSATEAGGQ